MDTQQIFKFLKEKGYPHIYEWEDKPSTRYEEHQHQGKNALYTIGGSIELQYSDTGEKYTLQAGDYFEVDAQRNHTAKVGKNGWKVIVGEEIEGDS